MDLDGLMAFFMANTGNTMRLFGRSHGAGQPQTWKFSVFGSFPQVYSSRSCTNHSYSEGAANRDPEPIAESKLAEREDAIKDGIIRALVKLKLLPSTLVPDGPTIDVSDDEFEADEASNASGVESFVHRAGSVPAATSTVSGAISRAWDFTLLV